VKRVAVLKGGRSLERQVSLRSGARVQELLEVLGIPYTGSGVSACLRCADKVLAKHVMRDAQIPTPDFVAFSEAAFRELGAAAALPAIEERLDFPLVVKPAGQGSALGVKFAPTAADVPAALVAAFSYDRKVLLERHVRGRDLAVSVLEPPGQSPFALPVVEAVPREDSFYDFESRYEIGRTRFVCPAELTDHDTHRAQDLALAAYRALGCSGFARIDLMLADEHDVQPPMCVLEANSIPGLTETSLLPQAADAAGIGFDELIGQILDTADARGRQRSTVS
jgi:D-alanine-D-alanine ligase